MIDRPRIAVIVSHGQPSTPAPAEINLAWTAARVSDHLTGWDVRSATLACNGAIERAMRDGAVVFPFFMAKGWFTGKVLPKRLDGYNYSVTAPFGLLHGLPAATAQLLQEQFTARPDAPRQVHLAAHGSARGPKAFEATEQFANALRAQLPDVIIKTGYIEQAPYVYETAEALSRDAICLPFFAQSGEHVRDDIPDALNTAGFHGKLLPSLGTCDQAARLIAHEIQTLADKLMKQNTPQTTGYR